METAIPSQLAPIAWSFYIALQVCYGLRLDAAREHRGLCEIAP